MRVGAVGRALRGGETEQPHGRRRWRRPNFLQRDERGRDVRFNGHAVVRADTTRSTTSAMSRSHEIDDRRRFRLKNEHKSEKALAIAKAFCLAKGALQFVSSNSA